MKLDINKYLGIPYSFKVEEGTHNCFSLVESVIRDSNKPFPLIDYSSYDKNTYQYILNQLRTNESLFIETTEKEGSIVVFKIGGIVRHLGYMIDDKRFIHILKDSSVSVERVDNPTWEKRVVGFYKYKGWT